MLAEPGLKHEVDIGRSESTTTESLNGPLMCHVQQRFRLRVTTFPLQTRFPIQFHTYVTILHTEHTTPELAVKKLQFIYIPDTGFINWKQVHSTHSKSCLKLSPTDAALLPLS